MRKQLLLVTLSIILSSTIILAQSPYFSSSLHAKRNGKAYWYNTVQNGGTGGFETLTGVPISQHNMGCTECHGPKDANGNAYTSTYTPSCFDCHNSTFQVVESQCLGCHSRQQNEINSYSDVHRTKGFTCVTCHKTKDVHGDGKSYNSMLEPGAITASCTNTGCHPTMSATHATYDPHGGKLDCTTCHSQSVISCYNCHFESQVDAHMKRPKQMIKDFILLVNRTKDGKVGTASFQSLSYQGKTWAAFGPYTGHTIKKQGRTCVDCHNNAAITEYSQTGQIYFAKWNSADSTLSNLKGAIPIPPDYVTSFKMDFITYKGNVTDSVKPSKNWVQIPINPSTHGYQMLFATPLTSAQMMKLGATTVPVELTSFTAVLKGMDVYLNWTTATETNNRGFEIERKIISENFTGKFETVAFKKGYGTDTKPHSYLFAENASNLNATALVYRLKQIDFDGKFVYSGEKRVEIELPFEFRLEQNYPNPFNPATNISYQIPSESRVILKVYNTIGAEIATIVNEVKPAGSYKAVFNASSLTSGIYYYKIQAGSFTSTKKLVLIK